MTAEQIKAHQKALEDALDRALDIAVGSVSATSSVSVAEAVSRFDLVLKIADVLAMLDDANTDAPDDK